MKRIWIYMLAGVWGILISSCSGFLDTAPNDALDPIQYLENGTGCREVLGGLL